MAYSGPGAVHTKRHRSLDGECQETARRLDSPQSESVGLPPSVQAVHSSWDVGCCLPVSATPLPFFFFLNSTEPSATGEKWPTEAGECFPQLSSDFTQLWQTVSQRGWHSSSAKRKCRHDGPDFRSGAQLLFVLTSLPSPSGATPGWNLATKAVD